MTDHQHGASSPADHFDEAAKTWDDPDKLERARSTAELLRERLRLSPTDRVLDIGGGTGQLSLHLADAVGEVTVADVSAGMVQVAAANIAAARLGDRFTAVRLDLATEPAPNAPYDGAWSQLAWHHVPDVDLLLRRTRETLVPGGWLAVVELDTDSAGAFHSNYEDFDGHHGFDRNSFADRMRAAGFRDVTVADGGSVGKEIEGHGRDTFTMFLAIGYAGG